jgi:hypothetical protein
MSDAALFPILTAILGTGCGAALLIGLQGRRMMQSQQLRANRRQQLLETELGKLRSTLAELKQRLEECEQRSEQLVPPQAPASGFNLNRRTQALRLLRRGDTPDHVARSLSVPKQEVELLQKVQQILLSPEPVATLEYTATEPATVREDVRREPSAGPVRFQPPVIG